jgi:hypothetical protein
MTQLQLLAKLLTRKRGVTGMEVIRECRKWNHENHH